MAAGCITRLLQKTNANLNSSGSLLTWRCFCKSAVTRKRDKFSIGPKKKRISYKKQESKKSTNQVFQLDPLRGEHAPPLADTVRQSTVARVIQQAMDEVLACPDFSTQLGKCQIEVMKVQMTRDLGHATITWRANNPKDTDSDLIQRLLDEHKNDMRNLLPVYHRLHVNPQLVFSQDRTEQYAQNVNKLLDKVDYGG